MAGSVAPGPVVRVGSARDDARMLTIRGRFDPGSKVQLLQSMPTTGLHALRPHAPTVIETAVADADGTVTFAFTVPADRSYRRGGSPYWVRGRSGHHPIEFRAITVGPDETADPQPPLAPDRPWTPRAPK